MTTQYTPTLKLALPVTGELSGTWGDVVNDNITSMIEQAIAGLSTINTWTANAHTLTTANGTTSESRCAMLVAATGAGGTALTGAGEIICPAAAKLYVVQNTTAFVVTLKTSAGTGVAVAAGDTAFLFCDATNVNSCVTTIVNGNITGNLTVGGNATINGNTTLGNATSDTITATARFASDLVPLTDNARDLGSAANSWRSLWIDGTATMALVAIAGGTIDGVSIGSTTAATIINVDNLRLDGNTLSSTDTNGNVVIAPNGTGDVQLDADTVRVGDSAAAATLTSNGAGALTVTTGGTADLTLSTNAGVNSGTVVIANGVNGNITLTPNGTGDVILSADRVQMGDSNTDTTLTTNGTGSLNLTTNDGTNSGTIQIAQGINGNITLTPNGTGSVSISKLYSSGNTTLGATSANTLSVAALVNSNLLFTDATYDIGATGANRPRDLFLSRNLTVGGTLTLTGGVNLNGNVTVGDASTDTLTINSTITSNLIFTDNTYDIGASGATRPRNLYLAGTATIGGNTAITGTLSTTGTITASNATALTVPNGYQTLYRTANDTSSLLHLQFFRGTGAGAYAGIFTTGDASNGVASLNLNINGTDIAKTSSTGLAVTGTFSSTLGATIQGLTVGLGAGAVSTNTAVGVGAIAATATGIYNTAIGYSALAAVNSGGYNTAIGRTALTTNTTGVENTAVGANALQSNLGGSYNFAGGVYSLVTNSAGSYNTAVGHSSLWFTTGSSNTAVGFEAGKTNVSGTQSVYVGTQSGLYALSSYNTGVGYGAVKGASGTATGEYNTGVGLSALAVFTSGERNTATGVAALAANTSGSYNTALGMYALLANSSGSYNTAMGYGALANNLAGPYSVALGYQAAHLYSGVNGINTIIGTQAGYSATSSAGNYASVFVGFQSGYNLNGLNASEGIYNTFVGTGSGAQVTRGSKNTIIGCYNGNQSGLDIRTSNNNIVLSDGDGNPRGIFDSGGNLRIGTTTYLLASNRRMTVYGQAGIEAVVTGTTGEPCVEMWQQATSGNNAFTIFYTEGTINQRGSITYNRAGGLTVYNTTSDYRAKDIYGAIADSGSVIDSVPVYMGKMKGATQERPMFIAHETPEYAHTGEKDAVDADGNPVYQQMDASALVPVMWAEIQSLRKRLVAAGI